MADLQPVAAAVTGLVVRGQPFQHDALEAEFAAGFGQGTGLPGKGRRDTEMLLRQGEAVEQCTALGVRTAQQRPELRSREGSSESGASG